MSQKIAVLEGVTAGYDSTVVLEDVDLTIWQDDILGVIGPNGGGKTTLLKVMLGLITPAKGRVELFGARPPVKAGLVGYVPQASTFQTDFPASVLDVVLMGRIGISSGFGHYSGQDVIEAQRALERVGMLGLKDRRIGRLSGGQKQRVFIARALSSGPRLLLLDEPTSSVDPTMQEGFYELLSELSENMAVVLVSHDVGVISVHVNKIACVNRQVLYHGSKELGAEELRTLYQCPVDVISHDHPHRVKRGGEAQR